MFNVTDSAMPMLVDGIICSVGRFSIRLVTHGSRLTGSKLTRPTRNI